MPYNHPVLGVPCITVNEFWNIEAQKEGRKPCDLIDDFYSELAKDEELTRQNIIADKQGALDSLRKYYDPDYCDDITFMPVEVINIIDANVSIGMRKSTVTFRAIVKCDDSKTRTLEYTEYEYAGSYMEPPDFECDCVEIETDI